MLVEHLFRKGDITFTFGHSQRLSALHGIRAHQKIQKSRPLSYMSEVGIVHRVKSENLILDIQGRIDGVYEKDGLVVVEEIKTTRRELDVFIDDMRSIHRAQVKIYAAVFADKKNLEELLTQLTYFHTGTGEIKTIFQKCSRQELEVFLHDAADQYLEWLERIETWRRQRDRLITRANFPYRSFRKGQIDMICDVSTTIKHQEQLILQAPTGIGKTVAALYPAIKALPEGYTQKIFYLTARSTGKEIAEKTLSELHGKGIKVKSLTLTAKEKICFNPEKKCTCEECVFARGYYDRLPEAREEVVKQDIFTMEDIKTAARKFGLCPFELSLDLSLWVDCIICDFNYAFNPRVYLKKLFLDHPGVYTFLIDEAHNLVDRARDMFSAQISRSSFLRLKHSLKNRKAGIYTITGKIIQILHDLKENLLEGTRSCWKKTKPGVLLSPLRQLCLELERWIMAHPQSPHSLVWLDVYFSIHWFLNVADTFDENYATCFEQDSRDFRVKLFCINPSEQLRPALERAKSAVLFSATITPISYFVRILGLRDSITKRILPSPFPPQHLCLCVSHTVSTLYKNREATRDSLTRTLGTFVDAKKGNYFLFFPSYEYMFMILPPYKEAYPYHEILVQRSGMTEEEKRDFLSQFARENSRSLVGFVVMGGIFGEGIDLSGDRLSGAAVVGVGLPGLSPEREQIKFHFAEHNEPGFNYAYLYPGMIRVFQAAGRVIRTEKDRGAVLLIDSRYTLHRYSSLFPHEWRARRIKTTAQLKRLLCQFWNNGMC
ncbi:MAG: helicase C-terminal domain-containing protein [Candidatus Aminicenantes bacterium]